MLLESQQWLKLQSFWSESTSGFCSFHWWQNTVRLNLQLALSNKNTSVSTPDLAWHWKGNTPFLDRPLGPFYGFLGDCRCFVIRVLQAALLASKMVALKHWSLPMDSFEANVDHLFKALYMYMRSLDVGGKYIIIYPWTQKWWKMNGFKTYGWNRPLTIEGRPWVFHGIDWKFVFYGSGGHGMM